MKVSKTAAVKLLTALGVKGADKMKNDFLTKKLAGLSKAVTDEQRKTLKGNDKEAYKLLKEVIEATDDDGNCDVEVTGDGSPAAPKAVKGQVAAAVEGKAGGKAAEEDKGGKKSRPMPKKAGDAKGPGIIGSIAEFLINASEKKPLSKQEITDMLAQRFKDNDKDGMAKTVNVQIPNRLGKDKKLDVRSKKEQGEPTRYWVETLPAGHPLEHLARKK